MKTESKEERGKQSRLPLPTHINELTEDIVAKVISFTTPYDAARVALVSKFFKSAADCNSVWETFLPSYYRTLIPSSLDLPKEELYMNICQHRFLIRSSLDLPKKQLYMNLCDHGTFTDDGGKSFSLDKRSGKKCYILGPLDLYISTTGAPNYWVWLYQPQFRCQEVAELMLPWWLEIQGTINTRKLSKETLYTVCFVFKLRLDANGYFRRPFDAVLEPIGNKSHVRTVMLDDGTTDLQAPLLHSFRKVCPHLKVRPDGWMEIEVGEFYNNEDMKDEIKMSLKEKKMRVNPHVLKTGLIIRGFEIRPKTCL